MLLAVSILLSLALAQACPEVTQPECPEGEFPCWGGNDADGCPIADYCIPEKTGEIGMDGNECWGVCAPNCNENEVYCDNGYYNGCHQGGYCTMGWGDCPATCSTPCAYENGEQWCDNGSDDNGCWMGNYCAAECADTSSTAPQPVNCTAEELHCWGGEYEDYCIPMMAGYNGTDGTECHNVCSQPCSMNGTLCDNGYDNGCWMGNHCVEPWGECQAICYITCDYDAGEQSCDMGMDENDCWMGNYCAAECPDTSSAAHQA